MQTLYSNDNFVKHRVYVKEIFVKKMILIDIEPASGGSIKPRDHLVKIDNDDIATWTMTRGEHLTCHTNQRRLANA